MNKPVLHTVAECSSVRMSPRVYTHAVVGEYDREVCRRADLANAARQIRADFPWYAEVATYPANTPVFVKAWKRMSDIGFTTEDIEEAKAKVAKGVDTLVAERIAEINALYDKQIDGHTSVLQWSMSEAAARRSIGAWAKRMSYKNVRVVPAIRHA